MGIYVYTAWCNKYPIGKRCHFCKWRRMSYTSTTREIVTITVKGDRYRTMLTECFFPEVGELVLEDMWFQQDGAALEFLRIHSQCV